MTFYWSGAGNHKIPL